MNWELGLETNTKIGKKNLRQRDEVVPVAVPFSVVREATVAWIFHRITILAKEQLVTFLAEFHVTD